MGFGNYANWFCQAVDCVEETTKWFQLRFNEFVLNDVRVCEAFAKQGHAPTRGDFCPKSVETAVVENWDKLILFVETKEWIVCWRTARWMWYRQSLCNGNSNVDAFVDGASFGWKQQKSAVVVTVALVSMMMTASCVPTTCSFSKM